jgi:hypothetical protein
MKKLIGLFVIAMILGVGMATLSCATADMAAPDSQAVKAAPDSQTVKGDLLKIEGEFYIVKDMTGKEIRLHVDKTSKLEGVVKAGDKIEAQVTEQGHALSITKPLVADAQIAGPQTVQGDVLKMDGDVYIVKDMTGKEIRLHVDKTSKLEGVVKAGDKIEAQVTEEGHAVSMKRVQIEPAKQPAKK